MCKNHKILLALTLAGFTPLLATVNTVNKVAASPVPQQIFLKMQHRYEHLLALSLIGMFLGFAFALILRGMRKRDAQQFKHQLKFEQQKRERAEQMLAQLARNDSLTNLPNRQQARERIQTELYRYERQGHSFCLAFIKLDTYANVRLEKGEIAAEDQIVAMADATSAHVHKLDMPARWAEDEFVLVLATADTTEAVDVIDQIKATLNSSNNTTPVQFSAGIAVCSQQDTVDTLVKNAAETAQRAYAANSSKAYVHRPANQLTIPLEQ